MYRYSPFHKSRQVLTSEPSTVPKQDNEMPMRFSNYISRPSPAPQQPHISPVTTANENVERATTNGNGPMMGWKRGTSNDIESVLTSAPAAVPKEENEMRMQFSMYISTPNSASQDPETTANWNLERATASGNVETMGRERGGSIDIESGIGKTPEAVIIDVEELKAPPGILLESPPLNMNWKKRNSSLPDLPDFKMQAERKKAKTRRLRFSFAETPSTSMDRPSRQRAQSEYPNDEILQQRISISSKPTVSVVEERKASRKPTSYYEVYPLEAYDNKSERAKRLQIPRHDPRYQVAVREEFAMRKYTFIAILICVAITIVIGGVIVWHLILDFTGKFPF